MEKGQIIDRFVPIQGRNNEPIYLEASELEAFRLIDFQEFSQEETGNRMGMSRGVV